MEDRSNRVVKTTESSLEIVDIVKKNDGATVEEIQQEIEMSQSTVYKHLNVLLESGYLQKIGGEYKLGFELFHLGEYVKKSVQFYNPIKEKVDELRHETSQQVEFGVESGGAVIGYISSTSYNPDLFYELTARSSEEADNYEGSKAYMHTNALGKALLAEKSDEEIQAIAEEHGLPTQAKNTITSLDELYREVETIRERGFATTDEEWDNGLREVGMVVKPTENTIVGGFNVFGPVYQMDREKFLHTLPDLVKEAVSELEEEISERMEDRQS